MGIAVIDNYDSFTWNLCHLIGRVTGEMPTVFRNDEVSAETVAANNPEAIVLSPGPGHPRNRRDFGVCADLIGSGIPARILGVCLGHQGIANACGATVSEAPRGMHGLTSKISHTGDGLFKDIPQGFRAVRYHSLIVQAPLPPALEPIAWTADGELMALRHKQRPFWGVQFHPESIMTEHGEQLIRNFLGR